jgi:glycosyltransferase involved in cell wall biosynthesis
VVHISLITSLYRTDAHLPAYIRHATEVAVAVRAAGLSLEFILVANDATDGERALLEAFSQADPQVQVMHVARESLYASWNRGVQAARGEAIGFWNVDDIRTPEGLIEGHKQIAAGCPLVYFAHTVIRTGSGGGREHRRTYPAVPYNPLLHRSVMKCGPFFMFAPALYGKVGGFDERFRIVGDWEWCVRATHHADFCPLDLIAGYFLLHGGNLSDTGNPLQAAEENVVRLVHGDYERLTPVEPEVMRKTWDKWASSHPLPAHIQAQLWDDGAAQRALDWAQAKQRARRRARIEGAIRYLPKHLIDRTGLRPALARLRIVKARPK